MRRAEPSDAAGRGLTPVRRRIVEVIDDSVRRHGYAPSMREIGEAVGLASTSSVSYQLSVLEREGYLSREARRPRTAALRAPAPLAAERGPVPAREQAGGPGLAQVPLVGQVAAGVPILAGTDTMNPQCFPGFGIHDELALLVDAGLSPLAALQAATRNAAEFMGQLDHRGTIEAGKTADLVLLDKDPLADIHNTRSIQAVVLNGKLFQRAALDAMLAEAQTLASRGDAGASEK